MNTMGEAACSVGASTYIRLCTYIMLYYIHIDILCKVKVKKVEFTLEQAMEAQKGSRVTALLFL
jgi:hypothetical protein